MNVLHLFDVKQYIYVGEYSKGITLQNGVVMHNGSYKANDMAAGGLSYLFNDILKYARVEDNHITLCLDSPPTLKRSMAQSLGFVYKGGRTKPTKELNNQWIVCEELLRACDLDVVRVESLEADDIISSLVYRYHDMFDKIIIHSNDSDAYYMIDNVVSVVPVSSTGKYIDIDNYEQYYGVGSFGSITLRKLKNGEPGDAIPACTPEDKTRLTRMIPDDIIKYLNDLQVLRTIVRNTAIDKRTHNLLEIITPIVMTDGSIVIDISKKVDWSVFNCMCSELHCENMQYSISNDRALAILHSVVDRINYERRD